VTGEQPEGDEMANDVIFTGWGTVVRGREEQALTVFQETIQFWTQAQQDGRIESFEPILLEPHGNGLAGFILARGERSKLDAIRADEAYQRLVARAGAIIDDLGVVGGFGDVALARQLGNFQQAARELG
jgi:hypothetical protein